jgi:hypothetical protein
MRIVQFFGSLLFAPGILAMPAESSAQVSVAVAITIAPPELPVYDQPICPGDGYIWTPGYWAWGDDDYYWVPGTWVLAPEVGFLWTPGYWGWGDGRYVFYDGYWGPVIGFYGGINYGFGYFGHGYEGGRWDNGRFFYNRAVTNVNVTVVRNVYETRVVNNTVTRVSYNGGNGGINERPSPQEQAAGRERHIPPVAAQTQHVQAARTNPELRASTNHGKPPIAATSKPGELRGGGVVVAREGGAVHQPAARPEKNAARTGNNTARPENNAARSNPVVHPRDIPRTDRPSTPNSGNPKTDKRYQQQQEKLQTKQDQERQRLQQKQDQDQEHQKLDQQKASDARKQQVEQKHQQQTQQLQQRHVQQQQQLQQRQQPPAPRPSPGTPPKS